MSKRKLDTDKIARGLRARRRGKVYPTGGYPGAAQLAAEVQARFRVPPGGGRATDPGWSDKRLVPIARKNCGSCVLCLGPKRKRHTVSSFKLRFAAILLET